MNSFTPTSQLLGASSSATPSATPSASPSTTPAAATLSLFLGSQTHKSLITDGLQMVSGEIRILEQDCLRLETEAIFFEGDELQITLDFKGSQKQQKIEFGCIVIRQISPRVYKLRMEKVEPLACLLLLMSQLTPERLQYDESDSLAALLDTLESNNKN